MLGRRPLPSSERANMLVRLDFQKESNNLGLINIFPEVSKCLPIRTLRFSEQNSEILKYYLFSIKKNFFFILEGSWRAKLLFDRPVHGLRPREANSLAQDRRDGSWHAAPAPSWMGPAGSQPCTPGTAVLKPDILECEVKWVLGSITENKCSGSDGIPVELFQILKDDAAKVLHSV